MFSALLITVDSKIIDFTVAGLRHHGIGDWVKESPYASTLGDTSDDSPLLYRLVEHYIKTHTNGLSQKLLLPGSRDTH